MLSCTSIGIYKFFPGLILFPLFRLMISLVPMPLLSRFTFVLSLVWLVLIANSSLSDDDVSTSNEEYLPDLISKLLGKADFCVP